MDASPTPIRASGVVHEGFVPALQAVLGLPGVGVRDWVARAAKAMVATLPMKAARVEIGSISEAVFKPVHGSAAVSADWPADGGLIAAVEIPGLDDPRPAPEPGIVEIPSEEVTPLSHLGRFQSMLRLCVALPKSEMLVAHIGSPALPSPERALGLTVLLECLATRARALSCDADHAIEWLSARETEVFDLLVRGMSLPEISRALFRSQHTIHDHVKAIYRKNRAPSRASLMARALSFPIGS